MSIHRRTFVGAALAGLGACASLVTTEVRPVGGRIRLALRDHPDLARPTGSARLRVPGSDLTLYVLALADGSLAALSPICKHQGCTVDIEPDRLACPCHGSLYGRDGRVLRGPTQAPLDRFPTTVTPDGMLLIDIGARST